MRMIDYFCYLCKNCVQQISVNPNRPPYKRIRLMKKVLVTKNFKTVKKSLLTLKKIYNSRFQIFIYLSSRNLH